MPSQSRSVPPTIELDEHLLRPFRREDAAAWYRYLADPQVTEHTSWPLVTRESVGTLVEQVIAHYSSMCSLRWALARRSDDMLIGSCGYVRCMPDEVTAELAYDLDPAYWGRGLMTAAVRAVIQWATDSGQYRRIEVLVMTTNQRSIALLERTGFKRESLLPRHRAVRDEFRDFYLYSLHFAE